MTDDRTPAELDAEADDILAEDEGDQIAEMQAEIEALKDQALRYAAEADNTKRRAERDINDARAYAIQKFATSLLGVADTLTRALQATPKGEADPALTNFILGIEMTEKELLNAFERNGLKKIDPPVGEKFDPHKHQAVMQTESNDVEPGCVVQVLQAGYELFGRNVRPAMVAVSTKPAAAAAPEPAANPYAQAGGGEGGAVDRKA